MILKGDASQLEWRTYLELSQDQVGIEEILAKKDIHSDNQERFGLPARLIAKIFLFRWIYRGSAWAYAHDADFMNVSSSPKFWQKVIDTANEKYYTLYEYQNKLIDTVTKGEVITIPTGRQYKFKMMEGQGGELYWDIKQIVNYPNQGFAADLMTIARVSLFNRIKKFKEFKEKKILLFNTVHDDIELDCDFGVDKNPEILYNICITIEDVFKDIPKNFEFLYGKRFSVPLAGEVSFGPNLSNLVKFNRNQGVDQFYVD